MAPIYNGLLLSHKKIMPFAATWMDLEIVILTEVSQTEKDRYIRCGYEWNLKKKKGVNVIDKPEVEPWT